MKKIISSFLSTESSKNKSVFLIFMYPLALDLQWFFTLKVLIPMPHGLCVFRTFYPLRCSELYMHKNFSSEKRLRPILPASHWQVIVGCCESQPVTRQNLKLKNIASEMTYASIWMEQGFLTINRNSLDHKLGLKLQNTFLL